MTDFNKLLENLLQCKTPSHQEVIDLCKKAIEIFDKEDNILSIKAPVTVCGDIHGQFYDLIELFKIAGMPPNVQFLFMGDYVDRGYHSVETFSLLLCLKVLHPDRIWLLRGNHECRAITQIYGFYDEVIKKYADADIWKEFTDVFDYLPLSALINNDILSCHGGISPNVETLDEIRLIDRKIEVPHTGVMCDILWSDPSDDNGWALSSRGAGYTFGQDVTKQFNDKNKIKMICRGHQLVDEGYSWSHDKTCVTIFTAPNYCYRCNNKAGLCEVSEEGTMDFLVYADVKTAIPQIPDYWL